jgi:cytoskeletal protein CcmA (bactofilin family)
MFSKKQNTITDNQEHAEVNSDGMPANLDSDSELRTDAETSAYSDSQPQVAAKPSKPSIISEGFEFVGSITSDGTLNIAGIVKGKITSRSILVDVEGYVEGELSSNTLVVKGKIVGDVTCHELNVGPRALIEGTISYQHIHVQRGGRVAGKFNKRQQSPT